MKRYSFLFLVLMALFCGQRAVAQTAVPYSENFEAYVADTVPSSNYGSSYNVTPTAYPNNLMPEGWKVLGTSNSAMQTPRAYVAKVSGQWGNNGALVMVSSASQPLVAILPRLAAGLESLRLTFKYHSPDMRFVIGYTTSRSNASAFVALDTVSASTSLTTYTYNYANHDYPSSICYMAIKVADSSDAYVSIDDVSVGSSQREHLIEVFANVDTAGSVSGGGRYVSGTNITLTATPAPGYRFFNWDDGNAVNPRSVTVGGADTYVANFILDGQQSTNLDVSVNTNNDQMGSVVGGGHYARGFYASLTAEPLNGYRFVCWSNGSTERKILTVVDATAYYTALFARADSVGTVYTITARANNSSYGTVSGASEKPYGAKLTLTANPSRGYTFVNWSDGNTENPRTVTVTGTNVYIANFSAESNTQRYRVSITSDNDYYGSVGGSGLYPANAYATALAVANSGLTFQEWDNGEFSNPYTFVVSCDTALVAHFDDGTVITIDTFTVVVRANNSALGTVEGGGRYAANSVVTIVATPAEGAHFVRWNDGPTDATRNVRVTANVNYVAFFEADEVPHTGISGVALDEVKVFVRGDAIVVRGATTCDVQIFNAMGRQVATGGHSHECQFRVPASGVYMVRIDGRPKCSVAVLR